MGRKEIEEKDQDLLKDIRKIVRRNEEKTPKNNSFFQSTRFWLPVLVLVAILAGTMVFKKPQPSDAPENSEMASQETVESDTLPADEKAVDLKITYDSEDRAPAGDAVEEPQPSAAKEAVSPEKEASQEIVASTSSESVEQKPAVAMETISTEEETPGASTTPTAPAPQVEEDAETETVATVPPKPEPVPVSVSGPSINIAKLVPCAGVQDRQFVSPQTVFSLKKVSKPVVWMTVLTDKPPFTLTHVYYHNDKKYCEVPLEIKYPRMRTWSRLTLTQDYQTGRYRVEVVTNEGKVLAETEYTVVP